MSCACRLSDDDLEFLKEMIRHDPSVNLHTMRDELLRTRYGLCYYSMQLCVCANIIVLHMF